MGQKEKKQATFSDHRKKDSSGRFKNADIRGYARMRKAMLEREKRLTVTVEGEPEDQADESNDGAKIK